MIERAHEVLSTLQHANQAGVITRLADDLPLFQEHREQSGTSEPSLLQQKLVELSPDDLSPRDALEIVYTLKNLVDKS